MEVVYQPSWLVGLKLKEKGLRGVALGSAVWWCRGWGGWLVCAVPDGQLNRLSIGRAPPTFFDISGRLIQIATETPGKVGDSHGGRPAGALRAVEIHRMAGREELIQRTNALGQFLLQINGIEIPHGNPQELNIEGCKWASSGSQVRLTARISSYVCRFRTAVMPAFSRSLSMSSTVRGCEPMKSRGRICAQSIRFRKFNGLSDQTFL